MAARRLALFDGITWQATDEEEAEDVRRAVGTAAAVRIARQMSLRVTMSPDDGRTRAKQAGHAKVVFVSRICRKKNLDLALRALQHVAGDVEFDIYGPVEDGRYWSHCCALITAMPARVRVRYEGALSPEQVPEVFSRYHLFLFPTLGENFGRVVLESLLAGCPVLLSNRTPWHGVAASGGGWEAALAAGIEPFVARVNEMIEMDPASFAGMASAARAYGERAAAFDGAAEANRSMFLEAAKSRGGHRYNNGIVLTEP